MLKSKGLSGTVVLAWPQILRRHNHTVFVDPIKDGIELLALVCSLEVLPGNPCSLARAIVQKIWCQVCIASQCLMQR